MTSLDNYGPLFRAAYAVLHGGRAGEAAAGGERRQGESLEEYLARSRSESLGRVERQLGSIQPPESLRQAHDLLLRLLAGAVEADAALAAQVEAYRCGQFQDSIARSDRLQDLVAESARLDRELILALRQAEAQPGTLEALGLTNIVFENQEPRT